ncbi:uncharacterized protein [Thunnus thynnus]|uniref:uncharacterized protein n=1 Tax=Thunnus thynnus TaxID=8237 RepID=UPI0035280E5E
MQTRLKPMDGTSSTACFLSQRDAAKQGQPSWASSAALCPMINGDQVWLEELIGPSSNWSSPSLSFPSSSPGGSRSSSEGTGSLNSWSSGVTCLLHSSIRKQSQEAFQTRRREERRRPACPARGPHGRAHPQAEQGGGSDHNKPHAWPERGGECQGRSSAQTRASTKSVKLQWLLEEKIEAKVKFSQFLDEVTSNIFDPNSLQAFGKPVSPSSFTTTTLAQPEDQIQVVTQWSPRLTYSMAQQQGPLLEQKTQEEQPPTDLTQKTYLETDIDTVRRDDEPEDLEIKADTPPPPLEIDESNVIPPPPQFCQGFEMKRPFLEFQYDFPKYPHRSASLPKGINMVSDESQPRPLNICYDWSGSCFSENLK